MRGWMMRLFRRTQPPERTSMDDAPRDPGYDAARQAYQEDKQAAMQKQIELLARMNRLGYQVPKLPPREKP